MDIRQQPQPTLIDIPQLVILQCLNRCPVVYLHTSYEWFTVYFGVSPINTNPKSYPKQICLVKTSKFNFFEIFFGTIIERRHQEVPQITRSWHIFK